MRGLSFLGVLLFTSLVHAGIEQRIALFTQQSDLLRQICFLPDGTFLTDRILFNGRGSIHETTFDCNAQALALEQEHLAIDLFIKSEQCPAEQRVADQALIDLLEGTSPIVDELTCPGTRSASDCMNNLSCNLMKSIFPVGLQAAKSVSDHPAFNSCAGTGSCFTNIGKAIWDNLWDTAKSFYRLGTSVLSWTGDQIGSLWRAEDATSTRGIAATEVTDSELSKFIADPIAFLFEKGKAFLNAMSEGIKKRYGCAEWTGLPHVSECTRPMSWECADCDEKLNMVCGVSGYIAGNFVTNFFTGGAVAATRLTLTVAGKSVFRIARSVPGASNLMQRMATGGSRLGKLGRLSVISGTIRSTWAGIKASRAVQGTLSVARGLLGRGKAANAFARRRVFLFAPGQDLIIGAVKKYHALTVRAFNAGYKTTELAARQARQHLLAKFPRLSDITGGKYAGIRTSQDYLREATKALPAADRKHMQVSITTDAGNERRVIVQDTRPGSLETDIRFNFTPQTAPKAEVTVGREILEKPPSPK